jgi:hypothetical protein
MSHGEAIPSTGRVKSITVDGFPFVSTRAKFGSAAVNGP